ncbi:MAG: hypothetical protein AB7W37_05645 [Syntrophobacteraceae bacterium]|jgi:hypothetical protein
MSSIIRIIVGLIISLAGVFEIASTPYAGAAAVVVGGLITLEAINRLLLG